MKAKASCWARTAKRPPGRDKGSEKFLGGGAVSYRGALYYETQSEKWKRLNTIAAVFEYEVDGEGNTRTKTWEWK